jgi:hypothetical protein
LRSWKSGQRALHLRPDGRAALRGKGIAVVALARRLAGILFALLCDGTVYEPRRRPPGDVTPAVPA